MATQTLELEPDAFWRMVTEENLKVDGPSAGYMWCGKRGAHGWETYKTRAQPIGWLYQARRVATNTNAAGGAIIIDIALNAGQTARLLGMRAAQTTLGTHTLFVERLDEDNAVLGSWAYAALAASTNVDLPSIGTAASASANYPNTVGVIIGPGEKISVRTGAASGQANDTCTAAVVLLLSTPTAPTWDVSRSTNAAQTTLAASTISAANTSQEVYL